MGRLDDTLVERGLAKDVERARRLILAGSVLVDDRPATKAGNVVPANAFVRLRLPRTAYASRGGEKLSGALRHFDVNVEGLVALDIGAAAGGFTDCLLRAGVRRVIAVDVAYGQIAWRLRQDRRVQVLERTNARYLNADMLPETPQLAVCDVSFVSLRTILPAVVPLLTSDGMVLALVKPQFEVTRENVSRGGVVREKAARDEAVAVVHCAIEELGLTVRGQVESIPRGAKGNREIFVWATR